MKEVKELSLVVVEDNDDDFYFLNERLKDFCFSIKRFSNGKKGYDYILENYNNIDFVILDNHLPMMNGIEIAKKLHRKKVKLPLIFLSSDTSLNIIKEAFKCGALEFFSKNSAYVNLGEKIRKIYNYYNSIIKESICLNI